VYDHLRPDPGREMRTGPRGRFGWQTRESVDWSVELAHAATFLAIGSLLLLIPLAGAWLVSYGGAFVLLCPLTLGVVVFHGMGWIALVRGAIEVPRGGARAALLIAFGSSIAVFAVGLVIAFALAGPWWGLVLVLFPYATWVWAPVVLVHAVFFLAAGAFAKDPRLLAWSAAGVATLVLLAAIGLSLGAPPRTGLEVVALPGATAAGYGLLAIGWRGARPVI